MKNNYPRKYNKLRRLFESDEVFEAWVRVRTREKKSIILCLLTIAFLMAQVYYYQHVMVTDGFPPSGEKFLLEFFLIVGLSLSMVSSIDKFIETSTFLRELKRLEKMKRMQEMTVEEALNKLFERLEKFEK